MTIIIEIIKFITVTLVVYALLSAIAALIKRQRDAKAKATDGIPHVPQPLKRLPAKVIALESGGSILRSCTETEPIELRKQYINTGAVAVYIALKPGGDGIEIAYFDDDDPEFNSLQADELIEAMTRAKSDYLLTTVRNK